MRTVMHSLHTFPPQRANNSSLNCFVTVHWGIMLQLSQGFKYSQHTHPHTFGKESRWRHRQSPAPCSERPVCFELLEKPPADQITTDYSRASLAEQAARCIWQRGHVCSAALCRNTALFTCPEENVTPLGLPLPELGVGRLCSALLWATSTKPLLLHTSFQRQVLAQPR